MQALANDKESRKATIMKQTVAGPQLAGTAPATAATNKNVNWMDGAKNTVVGKFHIVSGNQNVVQGMDLDISGNQNIIKGANSTVVGDKNQLVKGK